MVNIYSCVDVLHMCSDERLSRFIACLPGNDELWILGCS